MIKLPEKIWIPKDQILEALKIDIQKSIEYPTAKIDHLEWKDDGILVHIKYGETNGHKS